MVMGTENILDYYKSKLEESLGITHLNFDKNARMFHNFDKPDKITSYVEDGIFLYDDYHYDIYVTWKDGKNKYTGIIPIETKEVVNERIIIPFLWKSVARWHELDEDKMLQHLRNMVEEKKLSV